MVAGRLPALILSSPVRAGMTTPLASSELGGNFTSIYSSQCTSFFNRTRVLFITEATVLLLLTLNTYDVYEESVKILENRSYMSNYALKNFKWH